MDEPPPPAPPAEPLAPEPPVELLAPELPEDEAPPEVPPPPTVDEPPLVDGAGAWTVVPAELAAVVWAPTASYARTLTK